MHVKKTTNSPTSITLQFSAKEADLSPFLQNAVKKLGANVKLAGFRSGKAPLNLLQKNLDQGQLQTQVIEDSVNSFYSQTITEQRIKPVSRPEVEIKKFVPFTDLEFETKVDVIGPIKLADYKKIRLAQPKVTVTAEQVNEVLDSLRTRSSKKSEVKRAAKSGDEVTIAFKGVDEKGKEINGAAGSDYPLVLGSNSFIPGFEDELTGLKAGDSKTFDIRFPKDYGVSALANKKVTFSVDVSKVQELVKPALDDKFAADAGPFKSLKDLKADIKTQLTQEKQNEAARQYENELIAKITDKSQLQIPDALVEEQLDAAEREERQNLMYRGQTWEEHLKAEGVTEKQHRENNRQKAAERVKAGLVLSEISEAEGIDVSKEELDMRIKLLKGQYQDAAMQAELDKPENQRDIAARMLAEKTITKLVGYANKKA